MSEEAKNTITEDQNNPVFETTTEEQDSPENTETQECDSVRKIASEKRPLLNSTLIFATLLAASSPALADKADSDVSQDSKHMDMERLYSGHEKPTTYLKANELGHLNSAMKVLFSQYTHFSMWSELLSKGRKNAAEKLLNNIMDIKTRHNYWYQKQPNGEITIRERSEYSRILIRIKHGLITEIDGFKINYSNINKPHEEQKKIESYIKTIGPKIRHRNEPTIETGHPPIITEADETLYSLYNMELPYRIQKLLNLKGRLTPEEERVKRELDTLLVQHPRSMKDMKKSIREYRKTRNMSKLKRRMIFVIKRSAVNVGGRKREATPNGMFEIVRTGNAGGQIWQTVAVVSMDGHVMERRNGKWEKSDNSGNSYGNHTNQMQHGKLLTSKISDGFKQTCSTELQQYRTNIFHMCNNIGAEHRGACLARYATRHKGCVQEKIRKWQKTK